jgi:hypothetical protein
MAHLRTPGPLPNHRRADTVLSLLRQRRAPCPALSSPAPWGTPDPTRCFSCFVAWRALVA